jgi:hypothetical protein
VTKKVIVGGGGGGDGFFSVAMFMGGVFVEI